MSNDNTKVTSQTDKSQNIITKKIGNTTFEAHIYFSETSKETFTDKVLRLIKNEAVSETK